MRGPTCICWANLTPFSLQLPVREFTSSGSAMTILFSTDATGDGDGFVASYSC